jgi:hypothetical protein
MNISSLQNDPRRSPSQADPDSNLRALDKVHAIFTSLSKFINAKTIYSANNPNVRKFAQAFYQSVRDYFEIEKDLQLTIEQYQILWREQPVYENLQKSESIAFLLYKDGVGEITLLASVTPDELDRFTDLIKKEIHNPSTHFDIVNRLWEADFKHLFYRIYDECPDGTSGDKRGSSGGNLEHPMRGDDHPDIAKLLEYYEHSTERLEDSFSSICEYFTNVIENSYPDLTTRQKEQYIQKMLQSFFNIDADKLNSWNDNFYALNQKDKLLWLLDIMLDFTQMHSAPPMVRDIIDMTERLLQNIKEEGKITSLIAMLNMQKKLTHSTSIDFDFQSLPERIEKELTNNTFLLSLGKIGNRSQNDVRQLLVFFQILGEKALPGLLELLKNLKDPIMSMEA